MSEQVHPVRNAGRHMAGDSFACWFFSVRVVFTYLSVCSSHLLDNGHDIRRAVMLLHALPRCCSRDYSILFLPLCSTSICKRDASLAGCFCQQSAVAAAAAAMANT